MLWRQEGEPNDRTILKNIFQIVLNAPRRKPVLNDALFMQQTEKRTHKHASPNGTFASGDDDVFDGKGWNEWEEGARNER